MSLTIISIDCLDPQGAADTMRHCMAIMPSGFFKEGLIFSDTCPSRMCNAINHIPTPKMGDVHGYSLYLLREAYRHINTEHCLVVQRDGYIINPSLWRDEFLDYDYIGAPWPSHLLDAQYKDCVVGNGGFSLRSRKLMQCAADCPIQFYNDPEDVYIAQVAKNYLTTECNMMFAPAYIAKTFSLEWHFEDGITEDNVFGFHGVTNLGKRKFL